MKTKEGMVFVCFCWGWRRLVEQCFQGSRCGIGLKAFEGCYVGRDGYLILVTGHQAGWLFGWCAGSDLQ